MAKRSKEKKKRRNGMWLIAVFVLFLLGVVGYQSLGLAKTLQQKERDLRTVQAAIEAEEERTEELERRKIYVQSDEYTIEIAKRYLNLIFPDEIVLRPE